MGEENRGRLTRRLGQVVSAVGMLAIHGCGGHSPMTPTPPPPGPPTITCPAPIQALAHNGTAPIVTFDVPAGQGGQSPVTAACTPAPGGQFQLGTTAVTCTATDALGQTGTCSFDVDVSPVAVISLTKFMAFGDSLTAGVTSPAPTILMLDVPDSYPSQLLTMLSGRYLDQTITMANEGLAGSKAVDDVSRFTDAVRADQPEVVLLLEGANDLNAYGDDGINGILGALEDMIKEGKARGAQVFLATLPPQNPDGKNGHSASLVPLLNRGIAATAADEGATLVDLYGQMGTYVGYIGVDGLHPTPVGYEKIAEIWRDAIEAKLEKPAAPSPAMRAPRTFTARTR
jgi:lysophospholipase L1-like esterase